jgi:hypothetical protein
MNHDVYYVLLLITYLIRKRNDILLNTFEVVSLNYRLEIDFSSDHFELDTITEWQLTKPTSPIIDETLTQIPEVTLGSVHQTLTLPFCIIEKAEQSNDCIVLEQKTAISPNILYLHKDGITYSEFKLLQESIPCLQGLSVDPQQFKEETFYDE